MFGGCERCKERGFVNLTALVELVFENARMNMKMQMANFELAVFEEGSVVLADIAAGAKLFEQALLKVREVIENGSEFGWCKFPDGGDVALRDDE